MTSGRHEPGRNLAGNGLFSNFQWRLFRLKRTVRMQNTVDATLLGGAIVRAGDLVIDGSLKGRLQRLATELGS